MSDESSTLKKEKNRKFDFDLAPLHFLFAVISVFAIIFLNFSLIRFWFVGEFAQNISSIEISYIQMAKFWLDSHGALWQPLWYLGYPWHVFYTPLLPTFEVILHYIFGSSPAHAYRLVTGAGYVLSPVALFLFVWQVSRSKLGGLVAALFYTFVPTVIGFLFAGVAQDVISGMLEPRRFTILVRWGEGPHTLAILFLPLFGFFFSRFLKGKKFSDQLFAAFFLGLVALTNAIAFWAAVLLFVSFFLAEVGRRASDILDLIKGFLTTFLLTGGLIAFWYNMPFIKTFFREGGGAFANWYAMFPWGTIVVGLFAVAAVFAVRKVTSRFVGLSLAVFWFLMLFGLVFAYYASGDAQLEYVPQVLRLNTEVDMALSVLAGVLVSNIFLLSLKVPSKLRMPATLGAFLLFTGVSVGTLWWGSKLLSALPQYTKPLSASKILDIKSTAEYRVATKVEELTRGTGERVLVPGNYAFWLNYFVKVPQLRGALYQSSTHFWPDHIYYQVTNGADGNISLDWFKIANIGKVVYTTIGSAETYKDYKVPEEKFDSTLIKMFEDGGDVYFNVPLKSASVAKVVDANRYKELKRPYNAIDKEPIEAYVSWIEQKSGKKLNAQWISVDRLKISGDLARDEGILLQTTFDPGWKVRGGSFKVIRDPFDFMLLVPKNPGHFDIEVYYSRPWAVYFGYLVTLATLGLAGKRILKGL